MAKPTKSNPEKGLRTVSIDFGGKQRTLRYGHTAIGDFEADANQVLRAQKAVEPGGMIFADGIISNWLGNAKIFGLALKYGLSEDLPENIDAAIDSFIEAGGSKLELTRAIITAYQYATNPSTVASLMRRWQISDDRQEFLAKADNEFLDKQEKIIAEARAKLIPGLPSTDLES
jgi:hypothetical protein